MTNGVILDISGTVVPFDYEIGLESGWRFLGYLHPNVYSVEDMMSPIADNIYLLC